MSFLFYCQNYKCSEYLRNVVKPDKVGQKVSDDGDNQIYRVKAQKCLKCSEQMAMDREL